VPAETHWAGPGVAPGVGDAAYACPVGVAPPFGVAAAEVHPEKINAATAIARPSS
jgi:hypothetical protein